MSANKILVAYFSASGVTAKTAKLLAEAANADLFEIKPTVPYTRADLNWWDKKSRSTLEMKDQTARPAISDRVTGMDTYDIVFLCFPLWWYEAPRIISPFLESYEFREKRSFLLPHPAAAVLAIQKTYCMRWFPTRKMAARQIAEQSIKRALTNWIQELNL